MKKFLLFLSAVCFFQGAIAQDSQIDTNKIMEQVQGFISAIRQYSSMGIDGPEDNSLYGRILEFKDTNDPQLPFANDLPFAQNEKTVGIMSYLNAIDQSFNNKISIEYDTTGVRILDCIQVKHTSKGDLRFAYASFKKKITYQNITREVTEVAAVDLDNNYLIPSVFFPDDLENASGMCSNKIIALGTNPDTRRSIEPNNTYKEKITHADLLFNNSGYELAKIEYAEIIKKFPRGSQNDNLAGKMDLCNTMIKSNAYNKMMRYATYYYNNGIYNKAVEFYGYALEYQPNDADASAGIVKCRTASDPSRITVQIQYAEQTEAEGPENFGKAYQALSTAEPSGQLSTNDYYFMIENLYEKNPLVMREMNYSESDCENYLNIYRYKLRRAMERDNNSYVRSDVLVLLKDINAGSKKQHGFVRSINYYPAWVIKTKNRGTQRFIITAPKLGNNHNYHSKFENEGNKRPRERSIPNYDRIQVQPQRQEPTQAPQRLPEQGLNRNLNQQPGLNPNHSRGSLNNGSPANQTPASRPVNPQSSGVRNPSSTFNNRAAGNGNSRASNSHGSQSSATNSAAPRNSATKPAGNNSVNPKPKPKPVKTDKPVPVLNQ